eukprot:5200601-Alexandrium_andersonii.AAC.1
MPIKRRGNSTPPAPARWQDSEQEVALRGLREPTQLMRHQDAAGAASKLQARRRMRRRNRLSPAWAEDHAMAASAKS